MAEKKLKSMDCKIAEGKEFSGKRICIIEDVVTTGGTDNKGVQARRQRCVVEDVICVIQREKKSWFALGSKEGLG